MGITRYVQVCEVNRLDNEFLEPLKVISCLCRSLSHRIRTPLSVISNDLSYFSTKLGDDECSRALNKCREISAILGSITPPVIQQGESRGDLLVAVKKSLDNCKIIPREKILFESKLTSAPVVVRAEILSYLADCLIESFVFIDSVCGSGSNIRVSVGNNNNRAELLISLEQDFTAQFTDRWQHRSYSTFSQLCNEQLRMDTPAPPLVDLVVYGLKLGLKVSTTENLLQVSCTVGDMLDER